MKFINPYILFALSTVIIPIIIHLFNFKRFKKIFFSNVQFLIAYKEETQKKSKLKHILILISRILTIFFLVLAFAQPYIPQKNQKINTSGKLISIYIDNSFSMEALSTKGTLLDQAKKKAIEIISAYNASDLFQLLTNNFDGKHQSFYSKEEFLEQLNDVSISSYSRKISEIIERQKDAAAAYNSKKQTSFVISDFQKSVTDIENLKHDTSLNVNLIPLFPQKNDNIYIDSCWFQTPAFYKNSQVQLSVLIKNESNNDLEKIPVKLFLNDKQRAVAGIDIPANSEKVVQLNYKAIETGIQYGYIEILDNPVVFDDRFYFSYNVSDKIRICSINGISESKFLNSLFGKDSAFIFTNLDINKLDYSQLQNNQFIILNNVKALSSGLIQGLQEFVKNGGSLLVFPSSDAEIDTYKTFFTNLKTVYYLGKDTLNTKVSSINLDHELYQNVFEKIPENMDFPVIYNHYKIYTGTFSTDEFIMQMQNDEPLLVSQKLGKGKIYLSAVSLNNEDSNFPKHALFVPTLYNMALYSISISNIYYILGNNESVEIKNAEFNGDNVLKIVNEQLNFEIIPEHKRVDFISNLYPHNQIQKSGNYFLMNGEDRILGIAYNYNRKESLMELYTINDLKGLIKDKALFNFQIFDVSNISAEKLVSELNKGILLWKICIILALLFIIAEVLLLRLFKHN